MFRLSLYPLSGIFIALTNLALFILFLRKGKSKLARIYSFHIFCIFLWGLGSFLTTSIMDKEIAMMMAKISMVGVVLIAVSFWHSVAIQIKIKRSKLLLFGYIQAFFFIFLILTDRFLTLKFLFNSFYYWQGTIWFLLSGVIWFILIGTSYYQLFKYYSNSPTRKEEILCICIAIIGFLGGGMNFLPVFGVNIYPIGNFLVPIQIIFFAYVIFRHNLFDIIIFTQKSVLYSALIGLITILYLIAVITIEKALEGILSYNSAVVSVGIAFILGILFIPIRNILQRLLDKSFLKATPLEIAEENILLRKEVADKEKMRVVANLASGMAHEIKNPLTGIQTFTEYLPKKLDDKEFLKKFSRIVGKEVERIDDLVNQLIEFARPSKMKKTETDIRKLIEDTLDFLSSSIIKNKINIHKNFELREGKKILIDPNLMKQALLNIFLNAIEVMKDGGNLTVSLRDQKSELNNQKNKSPLISDHRLLITVRDSGQGIPHKDLPRVFDPFFTRRDKGTGLGLAITKGIIQEHNGKIWIESGDGVGTKVFIELPLSGNGSRETGNNI